MDALVFNGLTENPEPTVSDGDDADEAVRVVKTQVLILLAVDL